MKLRGAAADAAFRLLPPRAQRTVHLVCEICDLPMRRAVRALVHDYNGDVDEFRAAAIYNIVKESRKNPPNGWPSKLASDGTNTEIAERAVADRLISGDRQFPAYLADVHFALTGQEKP